MGRQCVCDNGLPPGGTSWPLAAASPAQPPGGSSSPKTPPKSNKKKTNFSAAELAKGRAVAQKRYLSIFLEPFRAPNPLQETSFARSWRLQTPCTAIGGLLQVQLQAQIYSYHHVTYSSTGAQPCKQLLMLMQEHSTDYA